MKASVVWCGVVRHTGSGAVSLQREIITQQSGIKCTKADSSYATNCVKPSSQATSRVPKETKNNDRLLSCRATVLIHY